MKSLLLIACCWAYPSFAQDITYKWFDPAISPAAVIQGQSWAGELAAPYDRLPARAGESVPAEVWNLSHNSAGLFIRFKSNTSDIRVRYLVKDTARLSFPHMPATGVSGVDLYALDHNHTWVWAPGKFSFTDTIEYHYSNLQPDSSLTGKDVEFTVYLPLYNSVKWMEIGVPAGNSFAALPRATDKPVMVYGTSIAQGGCASRPGMAWTAILQRKLNMPLINLGFSGNGKLDKSVVDLVNEVDAAIYVLDCLPNMVPRGDLTEDEVARRITAAVTDIRAKHPYTPILLAEQSGAEETDVISASNKTGFRTINGIMNRVFGQLTASGVKNIFTLTGAKINLNGDATVDGIHPNDIGMMNYANAYNQAIRMILHLK